MRVPRTPATSNIAPRTIVCVSVVPRAAVCICGIQLVGTSSTPCGTTVSNFDPAINTVDNVYLYDVDDLSSVVDENVGERKHEAVEGEAIVEEEVDRFWQWLEQLDVVPTIVALRDHAETVRLDELSKTLGRMPDMSEKDRERIDQMTRAIVKKLLHEPTRSLKQERDKKEGMALISSVRELFGLGKKS